MTVYTQPTGNAGQLILDITYTQDVATNTTTFTVKRIISCSDPQTFIYNLDWTGSDGGTARSGTAELAPAGSWSPREVGAWTVAKVHDADGTLPAASRTFTFSIEASGTSGLGGPTTQSVTLTIPRIPRGPRVKSGGTWRNTIAYVKTGGVWKIAIPYVKQGTWKVGGS